MKSTNLLSLFVTLVLLAANVTAQESQNSTLSEGGKNENIVVDEPGFQLKTTVTDAEGNPVPDVVVPYTIKTIPGTSKTPNQISFDFSNSIGASFKVGESSERNLRTRQNGEPNTMRRIRLEDYSTDGVLFMGSMIKNLGPATRKKMMGNIELEEIQSGENISDFARRIGLSTNRIMLLNPLANWDEVKSGDMICTSSTHRVLPGETLDFIANLYQTDVSVLSQLNDLEEQAEIEWKKLSVPAVVENGRMGLAMYKVFYRPENQIKAFDLSTYKVETYAVGQNETLVSIAKAQRTSVEKLRFLNGMQKDDVSELNSIALDSYLITEKDASPSQIVKQLEKQGIELEDVLALNGLAKPSDIQPGERLSVPLLSGR